MTRITKQKACSLLFLLFLVLAAFISLHLAAQQKAPAQLPLPEMQRLAKLYVGRWEYTETYPHGGVNTGVYISEPGPGGNSIFNHFHSKGPVGEFDGVLVMTWDQKENAYKAYALGDSFPGALVETGQWEGDSLVFRSEMSVGGMRIAIRNTTRFLEGGKLSSDQFSSANGKPEALLVHVEAVKK